MIKYRPVYSQGKAEDYLFMSKYALASSVSCKNSKSCITDYKAYSNLHDRSHTVLMELSGNNFFLPTWMTPGTNENPHPIMRAKKLCIEQCITYSQYKEEVVLHMRGKKGLARSMNTMTVQGSVKMVTSPWKYTNEGYINTIIYSQEYLHTQIRVWYMEPFYYKIWRLFYYSKTTVLIDR